MMTGVLFALTLLTALGSGLVAGVFFAFSGFVMAALGRLPAARGIAAMQTINVAAVSPLFMALLFGTALGSIALVIAAIVGWQEPGASYLLLGGALYLVVILLTIVYHVPRNNALARVEPERVEAEPDWARYRTEWTRWNHVRTVAALGSAAVLTIALRG